MESRSHPSRGRGVVSFIRVPRENCQIIKIIALRNICSRFLLLSFQTVGVPAVADFLDSSGDQAGTSMPGSKSQVLKGFYLLSIIIAMAGWLWLLVGFVWQRLFD